MLGFIGHHVAEHLLTNTDWDLVGLDRVDETSTHHRMRWLKCWPDCAKRCTFVWHDLRAPVNVQVEQQVGAIDVVLHLAANTHVNRSIVDPLAFVQDNVIGTANLLEWWREHVRKHQPADPLLVHMSTDEVFGPAAEGQLFKEWDRYNSANPYSASKAGAEELVVAYSNTYKFKAAVCHIMNVFGERQHPEKFVPMTIGKVLRGETVLIHSDKGRPGQRFYVHAENVARALEWLMAHRAEAKRFDKWNIVGEREVTNLEMAELIAKFVGRPLQHELVDADKLRPGHDFRYSLDGSKLRDAGFEYRLGFEEALERVVRWSLEHPEWLGQ
jgi:dTDP-glucose 4,6-dehydratase